MKLHFYKYHGTGNDFILADNRDGYATLSPENIASLCHRRFGIGADGLILLEAKTGYDFGMRYFNSDGNESTMCGNGGRCITAFADFLSPQGRNYRFHAIDGEHTGIILGKNGGCYDIKLKMNDVTSYKNWGEDIILNTGSPHLVRFVSDTNTLDVVKEGRELRFHPDFQPAGLNINFVKPGGGSLFVRTYERGVEDETLSCGTGVTASALAYALKQGLPGGSVNVETPGGSLKVQFGPVPGGFTDIWLEGPAVKVFEGDIEI